MYNVIIILNKFDETINVNPSPKCSSGINTRVSDDIDKWEGCAQQLNPEAISSRATAAAAVVVD